MVNQEGREASDIHPSFAEQFRTLRNGHVNGLACVRIQKGEKWITCFELLIGRQRICWSVEDGHGRTFMMGEDSFDGAGVFPLSDKVGHGQDDRGDLNGA